MNKTLGGDKRKCTNADAVEKYGKAVPAASAILFVKTVARK